MGSAGWPPSFRVAACVCRPPRHGTTRHNGRSAESHPAYDHTCTTSVDENHTPHTITQARRACGGTTPCTRSRAARRVIRTTGDHTTPARRAQLHDAPSYHACTTRFLHHEHSYHASTTGAARREPAPRAFTNRARWIRPKACRPPCHSRRTGWHSAAASALHRITSKKLGSRARSGLLQCRVGR